MRHVAATSIVLVLVVAGPFLFIHHADNGSTVKTTYNSANGPSYVLGNYTINVINNQTVIVSTQGVSLTVTQSAFYSSGGKFLNDPLKSSKINRIDNSVQNTVALIDQFQRAQLTFIFDLVLNNMDITIVNAGTSSYFSMNFSTGVPLSANSAGIFWSGGTFGPYNYGHNVLSDNTASFQESTLNGFFTLNWMQVTAINMFDYGTFEVSTTQSILSLMFGPTGNAGFNYGPIILSVDG